MRSKIMFKTALSFLLILPMLFSQFSQTSAETLNEVDPVKYGLWIKTMPSQNSEMGENIIQTNDGGYVIVGTSNGTNSTSTSDVDMVVTKVDFEGKPQVGFGQNGTIEIGGYYVDEGRIIRQSSDGGYLVFGQTKTNTRNEILVVKISATGTLDTTFGQGGYTNVGIFDINSVYDVLIDNSTGTERYILVGSTIVPYSPEDSEKGSVESPGPLGEDIVVIRLLSNGSVDTSFGSTGVFKYATAGTDRAKWIDSSSDGGYVIGGYTTAFGSSSSEGIVLKIKNNGELDSSFGVNGISVVQPADQLSFNVEDGLVTKDGGIVLVGGLTSQYPIIFLVKLNSEGDIDTSFGENGNVVIQTFFTIYPSYVTSQSISEDRDGSLIIAGSEGYMTELNLFFTKLSKNGVVEAEFGENGYRIVELLHDEGVKSVNVDTNGNIIFTGYHYISPSWEKSEIIYGKLDYRGNLNSCENCKNVIANTYSVATPNILSGGIISYPHASSTQVYIFSSNKNNSFTTMCNALEIPSPRFPINGQISGSPVVLKWNKINAPKYQLTVKGPNVWWKSGILSGSTTMYPVQYQKFVEGETYTWKVKACWEWSGNVCIVGSPWSYEESFVFGSTDVAKE